MKRPRSSYTPYLQAIPDSNDELFMPSTDEILGSEDWRVGDVLVIDLIRDGILITNKFETLRQESGMREILQVLCLATERGMCKCTVTKKNQARGQFA